MTDAKRIARGMYWDRAWSLVEGCTRVSEGCAHCWSAAQTHLRSGNPRVRERYFGLTEPNGRFNGRVRLMKDALNLPLHVRKPTVWAVWNDLFHDDVPIDFIADAFNTMAAWRNDCRRNRDNCDICDAECDNIVDTGHTYLILTKRPYHMHLVMDRLPWYAGECFGGETALGNAEWPIPRVRLGTTAENQERADERIPPLLQTLAEKRFVSCEPLLGEIDLAPWLYPERATHDMAIDAGDRQLEGELVRPALSWVIAGAETGPGARPAQFDWFRRLRDQCQGAGVPFFLKAIDAHHNRELDGRTWDEMPEAMP